MKKPLQLKDSRKVENVSNLGGPEELLLRLGWMEPVLWPVKSVGQSA